MADEAPQQTQAPPSGTAGGEAAEVQASGGFKVYLPLILALVLMPALALGTFQIKRMMDKKAAAAPSEEEHKDTNAKDEHAASESKSGHGAAATTSGTKWKDLTAETRRRFVIPLTRMPIAYRPADKDKDGDTDKFIILDLKGDAKEVAQSDKIVVNISRTGATRFAAVRVSLSSESTDFLERLNMNRERLIDIASGELSAKTLEDLDTPGFRNIFRHQLLALFNRSLGVNAVREVIIDELVVQ